jgi:hypothetical protein
MERQIKGQKGLTKAELLIGLIITSILVALVATSLVPGETPLPEITISDQKSGWSESWTGKKLAEKNYVISVPSGILDVQFDFSGEGLGDYAVEWSWLGPGVTLEPGEGYRLTIPAYPSRTLIAKAELKWPSSGGPKASQSIDICIK